MTFHYLRVCKCHAVFLSIFDSLIYLKYVLLKYARIYFIFSDNEGPDSAWNTVLSVFVY